MARKQGRSGSIGVVLGLGAALVMAGCGGIQREADYPGQAPASDKPQYGVDEDTYVGLFGRGGIKLFGGAEERAPSSPIGVNSFLWRASLDTLSFMPLASADPFGGVIITDWYAPPQTPDERFKLTVYILDRQLRTDGIKVAVFRQERRTDGSWVDAEASATTVVDLENAILTRARQLRIGSITP